MKRNKNKKSHLTILFSILFPQLIYGGILINDGETVKVDPNNPIYNNTDYIINGGYLDFGSSNITMSSLSGTGGVIGFAYSYPAHPTLTLNQNIDTEYGGTFSEGRGNIIKLGSGTLTLTGDNIQSDATLFLNGGALAVSKTDNLPSHQVFFKDDYNLKFDGGIFRNTENVDTNWHVYVGPKGGVFEAQNHITVSKIVGEGDLIVRGNGALEINSHIGGSVSYSKPPYDTNDITSEFFKGNIKIHDDSTLQIVNKNVLGNTTGHIFLDDATLSTVVGTRYRGKTETSSTLSYDPSAWASLQESFIEEQIKNPVAVFNGNFMFGENIISSRPTSDNSFSIARNITLGEKGGTFETPTDLILEGNIEGPGALYKKDGGILYLMGKNTYEGGTFLIAGTLSVSQDQNLGAPSSPLVFEEKAGAYNSGERILKITSPFSTQRDIIFKPLPHKNTMPILKPFEQFYGLPLSGTIETDSDFTIGGTISGLASITKSGAGMLTLLGNNTYSGSTELKQGILSVSRDENLGDRQFGGLVFSGGILRNTGAFTLERYVTLLNAPAIFDTQADLTIKGPIAGMGDLKKTGPGVLTLSGYNSFLGNTYIHQGVLSVSEDRNLGAPYRIKEIKGQKTDFVTEEFLRGKFKPIDTMDIDSPPAPQELDEIKEKYLAEAEARYKEDFVVTREPSVIVFDGGTLRTTAPFSTARNVILAQGGIFDTQADLTINGKIEGPGSLTKMGEGVLTLSGHNTYTGNTFVNQGTLSVNGAIHSNTFINKGAQLGGNGTIVGDVLNRGVISPGNSIGTLTIKGDYEGEGGTLKIETIPGTSSADKFVVTGRASGTTFLEINSLFGLGSSLPDEGIEIVQVGSSTEDAFVLATPARVGAYSYTLALGANKWLLQGSSLLPTSLQIISPVPVALSSGATPSIISNGTPLSRKGLRIATQVYPFVPFLMQDYTANVIGSLKQRMGSYLDDDSINHLVGRSALWSRVLGLNGHLNHHSHPYHLQALQIGSDVYRVTHENGARDHLGVYGAFGKGKTKIETLKWRFGEQRLEAPSLGMYWTHYGVKDQYLDVVLQGSYYSNTLKTLLENDHLKFNNKDYAASIEGGHPFKIKNLMLEPQAQMIYQRLKLNSYKDYASIIAFEDNNSLRGRVGLRLPQERTLACSKGRECDLMLAVTGNIWREFLTNPKTTFRTLQGMFPVQFSPNLGGTWADVGLEATLKINSRMNIYGSGNYAFGLSGLKRRILGGNLGIRWSW